jgi:predicted RNA-binding Zn-ribbon protein involved in translation (DUF1610 family)
MMPELAECTVSVLKKAPDPKTVDIPSRESESLFSFMRSESEEVSVEPLPPSDNVLPPPTCLLNSNHTSTILGILSKLHTTSPDLCLVSSDGLRLEAHSQLLCLVSPFCKALLSNQTDETLYLTVPAPKSVVVCFLDLLSKGQVTGSKENLSQVLDLASLFKIELGSTSLDSQPSLVCRTLQINGSASIRKAVGMLQETPGSSEVHQTLSLAYSASTMPSYTVANTPSYSEPLVQSYPIQVPVADSTPVPEDAVSETDYYTDIPHDYDPLVTGYYSQYSNLADFSSGYYVESELTEYQPKKTYPCPDCGKIFSRSDHMRRHQRSVHSEQTPFQCDLCPRSYARADKLKVHRRMHETVGHDSLQDNRMKGWSCFLCGRMFAQQNHLTNHMKTHGNQLWSEEGPAEFIKGELLN